MSWLRTVGILRVLDGSLADVLKNFAAQGHSDGLYAATDAEDGNLPIVGQPGDEQFRQVALAVDAMQGGDWLFAGIQRVIVGTATEQQTVDMLQRVDDAVVISDWGDDDRHTTCLLY